MDAIDRVRIIVRIAGAITAPLRAMYAIIDTMVFYVVVAHDKSPEVV